MSKYKDTLHEGWLTKSPPTKRIWRGRWRRRWFVLHPGDLPQQYILAYYTDRSCRKLKGIIDLDHCDQVDIGFKFEDKKVKFDFMFAIKTQPRTYYLAADSDVELKSWVKCICDVCGLKASSEDDDGIQIIEEKSTIPIEIRNTAPLKHILESPPVSPVSTSPYIPISECITGKSPILLKDNVLSKRFLQNTCNSPYLISNQHHSNATYETPTYLNCAYPTSYETPRSLLPHKSTKSINKTTEESSNRKNSISPLQSPTGSDSVFTDENWSNDMLFKQSSRNAKTSDSFEEVIITEKLTKVHVDSYTSAEDSPHVPPRPPKPAHIHQGSLSSTNYFNISARPSSTKSSKTSANSEDVHHQVTSDEMYDFPRSHQVETDTLQNNTMKRHCYNNAAPVMYQHDGQMFKYDGSPQAGSSNQQVFVYDMDDMSDVPPSPSSQNSSVYYNLPSPLMPDSQVVAPPVVNRDLKPKRKLSDTLSITSNTEPSSPRLAPCIDRKLKPTGSGVSKVTRLQSCHVEAQGNLRKMFEADMDSIRKLRAAPSPTSTILRRSHDSLVTDTEQQFYLLPMGDSLQNYHKLEYLDLDLDNKNCQISNSKSSQPMRSPGANTVYKKVDFMKTEAFNITRNILEKERNAMFE